MHLQQQMEELGLDRHHHIYWIQEDRTLELLEEYQVEVTSMGGRQMTSLFPGQRGGWLAARWLLDKISDDRISTGEPVILLRQVSAKHCLDRYGAFLVFCSGCSN